MRSEARRSIGEYWLSKDPKSPNWCRTWYDGQSRQTRRASLGTPDVEEAFARLAEWFVANCRLESEQPKTVPLAVVFDRYLIEHAKGTAGEEASRFALRHWKEFYPDAVVSDLTVNAQESFIEHLRSRSLSDGYIARILTIGKAALNRSRKRQELAEVPHILSIPNANRERDRILSMDEAVALWRAVDSEHVGMYLALAFNTAARPDAILDLDAGQLDLDHRLVNLNPPGRRQTKKYRPVIPITDDLYCCVGSAQGALVRWKGKRVGSIKTGFRALRRRAGVDSDVIPYTIRHTMATVMRGAGVAPWEVAGWLGHKITELRTTERYAKFAPDYLSGARVAVDAYMAELRRNCVGKAICDSGVST